MPDSTYRAQVDAQRILQIREIAQGLPQACTDFLRHIAMTTSTFTRLAYALDLKTFCHFLHTERVRYGQKEIRLWLDDDFAALSAADLTAYTEYLTFYFKENEAGEQPVAMENRELSIKRKLCSIRAFYRYLFEAQRIPANVTQLVPLPKVHEKPILWLQPEEVSKMLSTAETGDSLSARQQAFHQRTARRDLALLMLFLGTGIRVSECVGINIADVDMEQNAFTVTRKGGNQVILYFPPEVAQALNDYMEERQTIEALPGHEDALFLSLQKKRITQRAVQLLVKKYASVAAPLKTRISPHKLRSTFATNLYQETGDIYLVADVLGHTSVDTTRRHYAHMTEMHRRMATEHVHLPEVSAPAPPAPSEKARPRRSDAKKAPDMTGAVETVTAEVQPPQGDASPRRARRSDRYRQDSTAPAASSDLPQSAQASQGVTLPRRRRR